MGIVIALLVLLAVVAIHEFGHFLLMRRNGVAVEEFSVGLGPVLFQRKIKSGTLISLRAIPLGGYVKPVPEPGDDALQLAGWEKKISRWARFKIYMAGMFFNSLAAFIAMAVLFYATGKAPTFLVEWSAWAPSALRPLVCAFIGSFGIWLATPVLIVVLAVKMGAAFFKGSAGPIGIVLMGNQALTDNPTMAGKIFGIVMFFAMINGAVAGFNLLPLFPLDGGRVAGMLIEMVAGKVNSVAERRFRIATTAFMLLLFVVIILSDFLKLLPTAAQ